MLKVQEYLLKNSLEQLTNEYAIKVTHSPIGEPLVILNYCQIDSPKYSSITRECRGLVLDISDNYKVVAKPFSRFFNYGESREEINKFNWNNFYTQDKEDGSLIILYYYKNSWRINTRGSFGLGKVGETNFTWEELFYQTIDEKDLDCLEENYTFVFELCTLFNKVVRSYPVAKSFLLSVFENSSCEELKQERVAQLARIFDWDAPSLHTFLSVDEVLKFLELPHLEPTFEGFVLTDDAGNRIKIKNKNYLRLHRMRGNGDSLYAPKNLIPFILTGETDELLAIYPEVKNHVIMYSYLLNVHLTEIERVYSLIWNRNTQKSFALKAMEMCPRWTSILFQCRKEQKTVKEIWRDSAEYILKVLDSDLKVCYTTTVTCEPNGG